MCTQHSHENREERVRDRGRDKGCLFSEYLGLVYFLHSVTKFKM